MGYEEDYFRAPSGLPEREIRALFSDLSNLVLWEEDWRYSQGWPLIEPLLAQLH